MPFGLRWASGSSPAPAPGPRSHETQAASHGLAPSSRVPRASSGRRAHRLPRGQTVQTRRLPSLRFSAPTACPRPWQQHDGQVCLVWPLAPSGFLDLSALSSASSLPALFHAGSAHGVVPFRAFLLPCSRTPSPAPLPSCRWTHLSEPNPPRAVDCRSSLSRTGPVTTLEPPKRLSSRGPSSRRNDLPARRPTVPRLVTEVPADNTVRSASPDAPRCLGSPPNDDSALRERPRLQGFAPHESPPLGHRRFRPMPGA
jgi:hypothetical protein